MFMTRKQFEAENPEYYEGQILPAAYRLEDESVWQRKDVSEHYPEIVEYYKSKGIINIRIVPCGPVDEDVLYVNDIFKGYCRKPFEWKMKEDLAQEELAPKGKRRS